MVKRIGKLFTGIKSYLKNFIASSKRVLKISKKPSGPEFKRIAQITGIGSFLIGMVGFVIYLAFNVVKLIAL